MKKVYLSVVCGDSTRCVDVFADPDASVNDVARKSLNYFNNRRVRNVSYIKPSGRSLDQSQSVRDAGLQDSVVVLRRKPNHSRRRHC